MRASAQSSGSFAGSEINLNYEGFRDSGLAATGSYKFDKNGLQVPDFVVSAFGGTVSGPVTMKFPSLEFIAKTHVQNVRMAQVLPSLQRASFPVNDLHWDSVITADTIESWTGPFEHFEISGTMDLNAPGELAAKHVPVTGGASFRYRYDSQVLTLETAQFDTPTSRIHAAGLLGKRNSELEIQLETGALEAYADFIDAIRGPNADGSRTRLTGSAKWEGKMSGPLGGPTLAGHASGEEIVYGDLRLDSLEADLAYSPSELSISQGKARLGAMQADVDGSMDLDQWVFRPENEWTADVNFEKVPLESFRGVREREISGGRNPDGAIPRPRDTQESKFERIVRRGRRRCVWSFVQSVARATECDPGGSTRLQCGIEGICAGKRESWSGDSDGQCRLSLCQ